MFEELTIDSKSREEFIDITESVRELVGKSGVLEGFCVVYVPHTTAGVTVNENADPNVCRDMLGTLSRLVPRNEPYYRHSEGNSDSHMKSVIVGFSHIVPIHDSCLMLGTWQGIFFCEFDGPRRRSVFVQVVSGRI